MANSHGIGVKRNDYRRANKKENKGHRWRGGRIVPAMRLIKQKDIKTSSSLISLQIEERNTFEDSAFTRLRSEYEPSGYLGEVDISEDAKDPRSSTLNPENFMFLPPFLKRDKVQEKRFAGAESSDRWWEWEDYHTPPQRDMNGNPL